jgi:hypothetical protein
VSVSDDRTGTILQTKLGAALESHTIRQTGRPTLIVIDEIDGVHQSGDRVSH